MMGGRLHKSADIALLVDMQLWESAGSQWTLEIAQHSIIASLDIRM